MQIGYPERYPHPTPTFRGSSWRFVCISFHCCRDSTAFVRRISGMELKEPKAPEKSTCSGSILFGMLRCSLLLWYVVICCKEIIYTFKNGVGSNPVYSIPWVAHSHEIQYSNFCDQLQGLALFSDLSNVSAFLCFQCSTVYTADRAGVRKFTAKLSPET